jgi:hypothetical protein
MHLRHYGLTVRVLFDIKPPWVEQQQQLLQI